MAIAIILILAGAAAYLVFAEFQVRAPAPGVSDAQARSELAKAANYLATNYNSTVGLIPETPGSSVYWLYSDNYLAGEALVQYGGEAGNATLSALGSTLLRNVLNDSASVGPDNQYAQAFGQGPCEFHNAGAFTLSWSGGVQIRMTVNNESGYLSERNYADVAFLRAICYHNTGNATGALYEYDIGHGLFNGTGLNDLPFDQTGLYQTYKLALCVYAAETLKQPVDTKALSILVSLQAKDGGFYTQYYPTLSPVTNSTNTETTSLAMLALLGYIQ